eukprot:COSAG02_NODE_2197_length_9546_cov_12.648354_3_plen_207_part_00
MAGQKFREALYGSYGVNMAYDGCEYCEAGKFSDSRAAYSCTECERGRYSSEGADYCSRCPSGKTSWSGASSRSQCYTESSGSSEEAIAEDKVSGYGDGTTESVPPESSGSSAVAVAIVVVLLLVGAGAGAFFCHRKTNVAPTRGVVVVQDPQLTQGVVVPQTSPVVQSKPDIHRAFGLLFSVARERCVCVRARARARLPPPRPSTG